MSSEDEKKKGKGGPAGQESRACMINRVITRPQGELRLPSPFNAIPLFVPAVEDERRIVPSHPN